MRAGRCLKLVSLLLALGGVPACGQMGPLSLPGQSEPPASASPAGASASPDAAATARPDGQTSTAPDTRGSAPGATEASAPPNADDDDDER
jgi:hypothetical protein